jgi:hypothetical protein
MTHIEHDIHHYQSKVAPVMRIVHIKVRAEILISRRGGAKLAGACSVRVVKIATVVGDVLLQEAPASLTGGWIQLHILHGGTCDVLLSES